MMLCEAVPTSQPYPNMKAPWTDEDDAKLAFLHLQEPVVPIEKICSALGRTPSSVVCRLSRLRLRRVQGGKMRKCIRYDYCGTQVYSTWAGERFCYSCRQRVKELA